MRGLSRHVVSVCQSLTFVDCVKTNKRIFKIFYHRVAKPFSFFSVPNGMTIIRREPPPLTGA